MSASVITGKIQDIIAGTSARSMLFESLSDPSFDAGGTVTLCTQKQVTCGADGTFIITLHAGTYRVVVSDTWQRSVWKIAVPTDGLAHDIVSIRVTGTPAVVDTYYTAAAVDALLATIILLGTGPPTNPPTAKWYVDTNTGLCWFASTDRLTWVPIL